MRVVVDYVSGDEEKTICFINPRYVVARSNGLVTICLDNGEEWIFKVTDGRDIRKMLRNANVEQIYFKGSLVRVFISEE